LLEERKVLLAVREARVVENHHFNRMTVAPETLVVSLDGFGNVTKAVGGDTAKIVLAGLIKLSKEAL
jgi:hypothetical protein